jgi:signal transduction histidine kinase/CheY-like chemotaxis protein
MSKPGEFGLKAEIHINEFMKPGSLVLTLVPALLLLPWFHPGEFSNYWRPLLLLSFVVNGLRLLLAYQFAPTERNRSLWNKVFTTSTYFQALLWGMTAAFLLQSKESNWTSLFAILVTAAMAAGSQGTLAPIRSHQKAYIACTLVPGILGGLWRGDAAGYSLTILYSGYFAFLWAHGHQVHRLLLDNWRKEENLLRSAEELQAANVKLVEASRAKSRFLADMSHEIRTPMNGVLGMGELLSGTELTHNQKEMVTALRHSGEHLMGLLNDILDLSKVEAGKMALESTPMDFRSLLEEVAHLHRAQAMEKGVELIFHWDERLVSRRLGDALRLRQVFSNLIHNAVKFTAKGRIELIVKPRPESSPQDLVVEVRDTGIGISPEFQGKIFGTYTQPNAAWSKRFGGSGLGLAIAHALIEAMKGRLMLDSALGIGTKFMVHLNLPLAPSAEISGEEAAVKLSFLGRVLVAEDNPVNSKVVQAMLGQLGLEVALVENGWAAHELATRDRFDLVLMDCQMPELDGLEATRLIRRSGVPFSQVPIVALTANAMAGDREKCLEAGMNDYLAKPINLKLLRSMVHRWLPATESIS